MNSVVKIIKRGEREQKDLETGSNEATGQQAARREIVSTVKSWIVELEQRRRAEERTYALLRK
jgi:hypothetical protein